MSDYYPDTVPDLSNQVECTTEIIGRGGYGTVYKGKWIGAAIPVAVAIKTIDLVPLRDEAQLKKRFKHIVRELSLWCKIQHKNILPLLGIARINDDPNIPAFVCPWMENGNAREFRSRNPHFPYLLILSDIINGLYYLHTFSPEIVHGDIKAVNVLINNRCEACLCDFGLSRFLIDNTLWKTTATHAGGTARWMSPELISGDASIPTKESDVYAYAMTCYEIISGDVPFKSISNDMTLLYKVTKGQRPDRTESFHSDFMWDIITRCWGQEPNDRPSTEKVLELVRPKVDSLVESLSYRIMRRSPSPQPPSVVQQSPLHSPGPRQQMRGTRPSTKGSDGALSAKEVTLEMLRDAIEQIKNEESPKTPEEKEAYFMQHIGTGEQLALQGPDSHLPAALSFFRAIRVYPFPAELIIIFQKTVPELVFKIIIELTNLNDE